MDTKKAIQIAIGLGVLFATVWVVGKAWKRSQNFSGASGQGSLADAGCPCDRSDRAAGLSGTHPRCCN